MTAEKSKIKMATINEIGSDLDDELERLEHVALKAIGGKEAFAVAVTKVEGLLPRVDELVDKREIDIETAGAIKKFLVRAVTDLKESTKEARKLELQKGAEVAGLKKAISITKRRLDIELGKLEAAKFAEGAEGEAIVGGPVAAAVAGRRAGGGHPGRSIKEQRTAEEKGAQEGAQEPSEATEGQGGPEPAAPPAKSKRRKPAAQKTARKVDARTRAPKRGKK